MSDPDRFDPRPDMSTPSLEDTVDQSPHGDANPKVDVHQYAELITPARVAEHLARQRRGPGLPFRLMNTWRGRGRPALPRFAHIVAVGCQDMQRAVAHPLSEEELGAIVQHFAVGANILSAGEIVGWAVPVALITMTGGGLRTIRVPFYTPRVVFHQYPPRPAFVRKMGWAYGGVKGAAKVTVIRSWIPWLGLQGGRLLIYKWATGIAVNAFFQSFFGMRTFAHIKADERLSKVKKELTDRATRKREEMVRSARGVAVGSEASPRQRDEGPPSAGADGWRRRRRGVDDLAPATEMATPDGSEFHNKGAEGSNTAGQFGRDDAGSKKPREDAASSAWGADPIVQNLLDDDDASPVAPSARSQLLTRAQGRQATPKPQGRGDDVSTSAWDQVRRQAQEDSEKKSQGSDS
jgi:hypothetical protein